MFQRYYQVNFSKIWSFNKCLSLEKFLVEPSERFWYVNSIFFVNSKNYVRYGWFSLDNSIMESLLFGVMSLWRIAIARSSIRTINKISVYSPLVFVGIYRRISLSANFCERESPPWGHVRYSLCFPYRITCFYIFLSSSIFPTCAHSKCRWVDHSFWCKWVTTLRGEFSTGD